MGNKTYNDFQEVASVGIVIKFMKKPMDTPLYLSAGGRRYMNLMK